MARNEACDFVADTGAGGANDVAPQRHLAEDVRLLPVGGVTIRTMPVIGNERGQLLFGEAGTHIPFTPRRYFVITNVPIGRTRGDHAHHTLHQFFLCIRGSVTLRLDDGRAVAEVALDGPASGVYVPPLVWVRIEDFRADAEVLVLASDVYREEDYIRDYGEFCRLDRP